MNTLFYNIGQVLGISIIHSLWQGLLVYLLIKLLFIARPSLSADKRYRVLFAGLIMMCAWFTFTFFSEANVYNWSPPVSGYYDVFSTYRPVNLSPVLAAPGLSSDTPVSFKASLYTTLKTYLPYLSALYAIGLIINLLRLATGWQKICAIRHQVTEPTGLQQQLEGFITKLGISKNVKLSFSELVNVPCTIGHLKPLLLLPFTINSQLSAAEVEAILLHELAHIRNNDYLFNLIQQVMAMLLFLNPFAHLISRAISTERENRCDDIVVGITNKPKVYARALLKLEVARQGDMQLAMAATSARYPLFNRIERLMMTQKPVVNVRHLVLALVIFISSIGSIAWLNPEIKNGRIVSKHGAQVVKALGALVKKVMEPGKPAIAAAKNPVPRNQIQAVLIDSTNAHITTQTIAPATKDTFDYKAIAEQLQAINDALAIDQKKYKMLPEHQELEKAQAILDSVTQTLPSATSHYWQDSSTRLFKAANAKFKNSDAYKRKIAEASRLAGKYMQIVMHDPEAIAHEKDMERVKDSVRNIIAPGNTGNENQFYDNPQWKAAMDKIGITGGIISAKIMHRPEVLPIYDSLQIAQRAVYSGPEYEEYLKTSKDPNVTAEVRKEIQSEHRFELDKYSDAVKASLKKLQATSESKKFAEDIKKQGDLVQHLKEISYIRDPSVKIKKP